MCKYGCKRASQRASEHQSELLRTKGITFCGNLESNEVSKSKLDEQTLLLSIKPRGI